jgi:hypothetical protein
MPLKVSTFIPILLGYLLNFFNLISDLEKSENAISSSVLVFSAETEKNLKQLEKVILDISSNYDKISKRFEYGIQQIGEFSSVVGSIPDKNYRANSEYFFLIFKFPAFFKSSSGNQATSLEIEPNGHFKLRWPTNIYGWKFEHQS